MNDVMIFSVISLGAIGIAAAVIQGKRLEPLSGQHLEILALAGCREYAVTTGFEPCRSDKADTAGTAGDENIP